MEIAEPMARHKAGKFNVYRNGRVHVCSRLCDTCIFRPGNLMRLRPLRVDEMVADAIRDDATIICHDTLGGNNAVCRGFYEKHSTPTLRIAAGLGVVKFQDPSAQTEI